MSRVSPEVSIISYLSISRTYLIFLTPSSHLCRTSLISHSFFPLSFPPLTSLVPISSLSLLPLLSPSLLFFPPLVPISSLTPSFLSPSLLSPLSYLSLSHTYLISHSFLSSLLPSSHLSCTYLISHSFLSFLLPSSHHSCTYLISLTPSSPLSFPPFFFPPLTYLVPISSLSFLPFSPL